MVMMLMLAGDGGDYVQLILYCKMLPWSSKSCFKSNKLRQILNCQFCHAISKNICLNVFESKQTREILVFVILHLLHGRFLLQEQPL